MDGPRGKRFLPDEGEVNLKITLSYRGEGFQGYQSQPHGHTVQDTLQRAWSVLSKGQLPTLFGCSRLDAGVHAKHFVLNLYTPPFYKDEESLMRNLNGVLHSSFGVNISVEKVEVCAPDFNARFDTVGKHYRYLLWYGFEQNAHLTPRCWQVKSRSMPNDLAGLFKLFEGRKDFAAYRASDCNSKTTEREIHSVHVWGHPRHTQLTVVDFWGEGFLKNMIRNIVGTVVDASIGRFAKEQIQESFKTGVRSELGQCAPPWALSLERVYYSEQEYLADSESGVPILLN